MSRSNWRTERWVPMRDFERVVEAARLAVEGEYDSYVAQNYGKCKKCPLSHCHCVVVRGDYECDEICICDIAEYILAAYLLGEENAT